MSRCAFNPEEPAMFDILVLNQISANGLKRLSV